MVNHKVMGAGIKLFVNCTKKLVPNIEANASRALVKAEKPLLTMTEHADTVCDVFQSVTKGPVSNLSITDKLKILVEKLGIPIERFGLSQENQLKRMIKMNYPFELAELSYRAEQGLPKCEKLFIEFTGDKVKGKRLIEWYQHSFENCGLVNNSLRKNQTLYGNAKEFQEFFCINHNILTENTGLIRGSSYLPQVKPGDIITDKGFMSTMKRQGIPDVLIEGSTGKVGYYKDFLIIRAKAGQKCIIPDKWGASGSQCEIILPQNTSLKVLEVKQLTDNGIISRTGTVIEKPVNGRRAIICDIVSS